MGEGRLGTGMTPFANAVVVVCIVFVKLRHGWTDIAKFVAGQTLRASQMRFGNLFRVEQHGRFGFAALRAGRTRGSCGACARGRDGCARRTRSRQRGGKIDKRGGSLRGCGKNNPGRRCGRRSGNGNSGWFGSCSRVSARAE